jgi:hypothetical protein
MAAMTVRPCLLKSGMWVGKLMAAVMWEIALLMKEP